MATETVEEKPVTTETPKGADAFAAARAAVGTVQDDTATETPAEDPAKVADQPTEATDGPDDTLLTPEELAALPPKDRAKAEKWQAKLTQKAQALSARDKELEEWNPLIEGLKTNPTAALESMAKQLGFTVAKAAAQDTKTIEAKTSEALTELPSELEFLRPHFEAFGKKLMDSMRGEIAPIKQAHEQLITEASAAETEATLKAFSAKYPGWEKHEQGMIELGKKILPGTGMADFEYMETLYKLKTADVSEAEKTRKVVAKINNAAKSSEDRTSGISNERVVHALPPPEKRSMRDAFEAAKRGELWEK